MNLAIHRHTRAQNLTWVVGVKGVFLYYYSTPPWALARTETSTVQVEVSTEIPINPDTSCVDVGHVTARAGAETAGYLDPDPRMRSLRETSVHVHGCKLGHMAAWIDEVMFTSTGR